MSNVVVVARSCKHCSGYEWYCHWVMLRYIWSLSKRRRVSIYGRICRALCFQPTTMGTTQLEFSDRYPIASGQLTTYTTSMLTERKNGRKTRVHQCPYNISFGPQRYSRVHLLMHNIVFYPLRPFHNQDDNTFSPHHV
jgi:hypothetical protein